MPGRTGMKHYPTSVKEQAVKLHLEGNMTKAEIMEALGICDEGRIRTWTAIYRKYGVVERPSSKPKGRPKKPKCPESPEDELKRLRMENEILRNFLYEATRR